LATVENFKRIWTWEFSHRQRPELDRLIDRFAQYLVNIARYGPGTALKSRPTVAMMPSI
jgi:hypothetical protein